MVALEKNKEPDDTSLLPKEKSNKRKNGKTIELSAVDVVQGIRREDVSGIFDEEYWKFLVWERE